MQHGASRPTRNARIMLACLILLLPAASRAADPAKTYWQLTIQYENATCRILDAVELPAMQKAVRTPGLIGAPIRIEYEATWIDGLGNPLLTTTAEFPIGDRLVETFETPIEVIPHYIPSASTFVVRLEGPDKKLSPQSVRFLRRSASGPALAHSDLPAAFEDADQTLQLPAPEPRPVAAGPIACTKIQDNGPDSNRLVIVLMGDGYTQAELNAGAFATVAANLVTGLPGRSPWDNLTLCANIYRIDVASNESGADRSVNSTSPIVDTYFNASYYTNGIQRLLAIDSTGRSRAVAAANTYVGAGNWDLIFMNVNCAVYGGAGGSTMVYSNNGAANDLIWHETGHTYAGLADEYMDPYPGFPAGDSEPNVDYHYAGSGLKWLAWVEPGTPLPTPATSQYNNVVGAFEGARYLTTGIYRPFNWCEMRALGQNFCPVCKEAHIVTMRNALSACDAVTPSPAATQTVSPLGTHFALTPIPLNGLRYQWYLDTQPIAGQTGTEIVRYREGSGTRQYVLTAMVDYSSPLVRKTVTPESFSWVCMDYGLVDHVWVRFNWSGTEIGNAEQPFNSTIEGLGTLNNGGTMTFVGPNASAEPIRITKPCRIDATGGPVRLGGN